MTSPVHYAFTPNGPLSVADSRSAFPSTNSSCMGSPIMVLDDDARAVAEFQLDFRLGEGSYGTVWAAIHMRTKKKFAIKIVQRSDIKSIEKEIIKEAVIMQGLRHRHVVQFIKVLRTREQMYFVMDLAEGGELFDLIIQSKHFTETVARKYFQQLISALVYCRKQGVVHRDLKAENLLLDRHGNLLVCDFGFSLKLLPVPHEDADDDNETSTFNCVPLGTLHYASPEAAEMVDAKALDVFEQDLWAASVILYFMLSGKLPFDGRDEEETLYLIKKCRPSIDQLPISEDAKDLLRHLLVQDPMDRFSMEEVLQHRWFGKDLDTTLFPEDEDTSESASEASSNGPHRSLRSNENILIRRHSSRVFLDFSQSPTEPVSPTQDEEEVIRRAFKAISTNGYDNCFTFDELRDALILLKKCTVNCDEVMALINIINASGNKDIVTFDEFRTAWIEKDLAHAKHQDSQFFQLFKLASLSHTECEASIVRQLRLAFDSVDEMHTGIISFPQWKRIFERASIDVTDPELHSLLQFWNEVIPDGSESISFEDFVAGIVKRDILLKHPLGKKLANATNLSGFAQLRHVDQSVRTGFLVLGLRESIADKLIVQSERLHMIGRAQRSLPNELVLSFWYRKDGHQQSGGCCHTSPGLGSTAPDSPSLLRKKMSTVAALSLSSPPLSGTHMNSPTNNAGNSPSKSGNPCAICNCQLDVILAPTACIGYTLVKIRRISGTTADFHDCVHYISSNLDREREQATFDCCARGDSELM